VFLINEFVYLHNDDRLIVQISESGELPSPSPSPPFLHRECYEEITDGAIARAMVDDPEWPVRRKRARARLDELCRSDDLTVASDARELRRTWLGTDS
jgi:hypothetical protein